MKYKVTIKYKTGWLQSATLNTVWAFVRACERDPKVESFTIKTVTAKTKIKRF